MNNIKESLDLRTPADGNFFFLVIRLHTTRDIVIRRYTKIQTIIANVGGILKFFAIILSLLNEIYGKHKYFEYIYNGTLNLKNSENKTSNIERNEDNTLNNVLYNARPVSKNGFIIDPSKFVRVGSMNSIINFNFFEILCCLKILVNDTKKAKRILFNKWKDEMKERLSILKFFTIQDDIEQIKSIIKSTQPKTQHTGIILI
jgi:hypothetical protein